MTTITNANATTNATVSIWPASDDDEQLVATLCRGEEGIFTTQPIRTSDDAEADEEELLDELNAWRERWEPVYAGAGDCVHSWLEYSQFVPGEAEPYVTRACACCGRLEEREGQS